MHNKVLFQLINEEKPKYDYIIENNGTIDELREKAREFLKNL